MRTSIRSLLAYAGITLASVLATLSPALARPPVTPAFTYQGQLKNAGAPANGNYDFEFSLWDSASGGSQIGVTQSVAALPVSGGLFSAQLNFGSVFFSSRTWLQIAVRGPGDPFFTPLDSRQELTATPYASGLVLPFSASSSDPNAFVIGTNALGATAITGFALNGTSSKAIYGNATQGTGVVGQGGTFGGSFIATATNSTGVQGESTSSFGGIGVVGKGSYYGGRFTGLSAGGTGSIGLSASGETVGVVAQSGSTNTNDAAVYATGGSIGVYGVGSLASTGGSLGSNFAVGVSGDSFAGSTAGSIGGRFSSSVSGANGVLGIATGAGGYGVWGRGLNTALAGNFDGPVKINGALTIVGSYTATGSKSFKIDHPLDPAGHYLQHSCIESSEMLNLYTGNAQLDGAGRAVVQMPAWFTAENTDFRYQLTSIGAPGNGLYIARKMDGRGTFAIAGGTPGAEVSWQVTAVRNDVYARAANFQVEVAKTGDEVGRYLDPRVYGLDQSLAIGGRKTPPNTVLLPDNLPNP